MTTAKTIGLTRWTFVDKVMSLLLNMLFRLVITLLQWSKRLLIWWLQSPSAVILEPPKINSDTVSTVSPSISQSCPILSYIMGWSMQGSLSITNSQSLLKLMFIKSVMPPNNFIFCLLLCLLPLIFPSIRVFSNESVLPIRWPKFWRLASASVFPMNIQDWFPLGWTGWISL